MAGFLHTAQYFGFICAQFTNLVLLFLIYKKAKKLFGSYRYVMFIFTVYSILYTWIEIIALPTMYVRGSMFILLVDSFLRYEQFIGYHVMCLYCASYALCISFLAAQFYYRYVAVCDPKSLHKLTGRKLYRIFVPGILFFTTWYSFVFFGMTREISDVSFARQEILDTFQLDTEHVAFVAIKYWDISPNGTTKSIRLGDFTSYFGCSSMIGVCFSTIIFCAFKIFYKLKCEQNVMSEKTKELNRQLLKTLGVQTAVPFFMMYSPVALILSLPIFEVDIFEKANLIASLAGLYPAIEPLVAMYFVKDFRRALTCKHEKVGSHIELQQGGNNSQRSSIAFVNKSLI